MHINLNDYYELPSGKVIKIKLKDSSVIYGWIVSKKGGIYPSEIDITKEVSPSFAFFNMLNNLREFKAGIQDAHTTGITITPNDITQLDVLDITEL